MQRVQDTYLKPQAYHSNLFVLSPVLKLPEIDTKFYVQYMSVEPMHPNLLGVGDTHPIWKGNFSPKISPISMIYVVKEVGKRPELEQIKGDITIERLLNPESVVSQFRLPSFRQVVEMVRIQRF